MNNCYVWNYYENCGNYVYSCYESYECYYVTSGCSESVQRCEIHGNGAWKWKNATNEIYVNCVLHRH